MGSDSNIDGGKGMNSTERVKRAITGQAVDRTPMYVHRIQRSDMDSSECFVQDNYYYLCKAEPEAVRQNLDAYEAQEAYTLEYATPLMAIQKNRSVGTSPYNPMMFEREARVLELLISEGYF